MQVIANNHLNVWYISLVIASTTTNSTGMYIFTNVNRGSGYQIGVQQPFGYIYAPIGSGPNSTLNSKPSPATGLTVSFMVAKPAVVDENSGLMYPRYSIFKVMSLTFLSQIGSLVFVDLNDNGIYEPASSEFGYNGLLVTLLNNGTTMGTTTTNSTGNYLFGGLYPGNYR